MTLAGIALLLLSVGPEPLVVRETVAQVEINHYHDLNGKHAFDQLIFRDWVRGELQIVDWRLMRRETDCSKPRAPVGGQVVWWDSTQTPSAIRDVRATSVIETWTQDDPELYERVWMPKEKRRELLPATTKHER